MSEGNRVLPYFSSLKAMLKRFSQGFRYFVLMKTLRPQIGASNSFVVYPSDMRR